MASNSPRMENPHSETASLELHLDPVGNHIIELREYYRTLEQKLHERKDHLKRTREIMKISKKKFSIPRFPKHYPFSHLMKPLPEKLKKCSLIMEFEGELPTEFRTTFIQKVLLQTGFYLTSSPNETVLVEYLSGILDNFLKKFAIHFKHSLKLFSDDDQDLMDPLETTLKNIGFGGISGLHTFYYENVARKHDMLYRKCKDLYNEI